jgi:iron complex outermembrane receptor protein/outer membrane receptor for ferrienterochelin and colicins
MGASYDLFEQKERDQNADTEKGGNISAFSPQIGVDFTVSEALSLYASVGKKIHFPTMRNLYADGVIGPQGNPDLQEEKIIGYEVGGRLRINQDITFDGALFYNDVKNMIIFDNQIGRFEQYEDACISGVELSLSCRPTRNLTARIGYTYLVAENDDSVVTVKSEYLADDLTYTPDEIPYRPKHKIDADLTRTFDCGLAIHLNGSYISERTYYDHADPADNTKFVAMKKSLEDYFMLNTKITYDVNRHCQVFGAVENILDENYQELYLFPASGLRAWAGIKLSM